MRIRERYVTIRQAAQEHHYCYSHIAKLAKQGKVRILPVGGRIYIDVNSLRDYTQGQHNRRFHPRYQKRGRHV